MLESAARVALGNQLLPPITEEISVAFAAGCDLSSAKLIEMRQVAEDALADLTTQTEIAARQRAHDELRLEAAISRINEALPIVQSREAAAAAALQN